LCAAAQEPPIASFWFLVPPGLETTPELLLHRAHVPPHEATTSSSSSSAARSHARSHAPVGGSSSSSLFEDRQRQRDDSGRSTWCVSRYSSACDDALEPQVAAAIAAAGQAASQAIDTAASCDRQQQLIEVEQRRRGGAGDAQVAAWHREHAEQKADLAVELRELQRLRQACTAAMQQTQQQRRCEISSTLANSWLSRPDLVGDPQPRRGVEPLEPVQPNSALDDVGGGDAAAGGSSSSSGSAPRRTESWWRQATYDWGARVHQPQQQKLFVWQERQHNLLLALQKEVDRQLQEAAAAAADSEHAEQHSVQQRSMQTMERMRSVLQRVTGGTTAGAAAVPAASSAADVPVLLSVNGVNANVFAAPAAVQANPLSLLQHLHGSAEAPVLQQAAVDGAATMRDALHAAASIYGGWQSLCASSSSSQHGDSSSPLPAPGVAANAGSATLAHVAAALRPASLHLQGQSSTRSLLWQLLSQGKPSAVQWFQHAVEQQQHRQQQQQQQQHGAHSSSASGSSAKAPKATSKASSSASASASASVRTRQEAGAAAVAAALAVPDSTSVQLWRVMGGSLASELLLVPPAFRDLLGNDWAAGAGRLGPADSSSSSDGEASAAARLLVVQYARAARRQFVQVRTAACPGVPTLPAARPPSSTLAHTTPAAPSCHTVTLLRRATTPRRWLRSCCSCSCSQRTRLTGWQSCSQRLLSTQQTHSSCTLQQQAQAPRLRLQQQCSKLVRQLPLCLTV
jgi:hypothetical protein